MIDRGFIAALVLAVVSLLAACTAGPGAQPPESVAGRQFLSTGVSVNGAARPLVDGTSIRLAFTDGTISASAGCNGMSGSYTVTAGQLLVGDLATTEIGCDAARHEQDEWLAEILASKPTLRLVGNELTLESDGTVIALLDREIAEPDLKLVGTSWGLESIARGDTVSGIAGDRPELLFGEDGQVTFTTGCNEGFASYKLNAQTVQLSGIGTTKRACADDTAEVEQTVLAVLGSSAVAFHIDGSLLKLSGGGVRLEYRSGESR